MISRLRRWTDTSSRIALLREPKKNVILTTFEPSDAQYINTFNPTQGLIGAWSNYGPAYQLKDEPNAIQPNLRQWSDVAFLEWKHQVEKSGGSKNGKLPAPKMILRINMMNAETLNVKPPFRVGFLPITLSRAPLSTLLPY